MSKLNSLSLIKSLDKETFKKVSDQCEVLYLAIRVEPIYRYLRKEAFVMTDRSNKKKSFFPQFLNQIIDNYLNPQPNENFSYLNIADESINESSQSAKEVAKEWSIYLARVYDLELSELPLISDLDESKKTELAAILKQKAQLIKRFLFYVAIRKDYPNLVNEFDWNINLVLATDQISALNKPLANLEFTNANNDKIASLELSEEEIDQLIEAIDKISNELKGLLSV